MYHKSLALDNCQIKFAAGKPRTFSGYASVFGGVDSYGDTILKGAYEDTIRKRPVIPMLMAHSSLRPIGKWISMKEDDHGLLVEGELTPDHTEAANAAASIKHGALSGLSIGFDVPEGGAEYSADGMQRTLKSIDLFEISPVVFPADDPARIDLTSIKAKLPALKTIRDCEDFLRDEGGLSKTAAATLLQHFKSIFQGDPGEVAELKRQVSALREKIGDLKYRQLMAELAVP